MAYNKNNMNWGTAIVGATYWYYVPEGNVMNFGQWYDGQYVYTANNYGGGAGAPSEMDVHFYVETTGRWRIVWGSKTTGTVQTHLQNKLHSYAGGLAVNEVIWEATVEGEEFSYTNTFANGADSYNILTFPCIVPYSTQYVTLSAVAEVTLDRNDSFYRYSQVGLNPVPTRSHIMHTLPSVSVAEMDVKVSLTLGGLSTLPLLGVG